MSDFELYPGKDGEGLQASFRAGVTLVVGANGLGKSTLVGLLYRMLAGACELSGQSRAELGSGQVTTRQLRNEETKAFSARVQDGARDATATLVFGLGKDEVSATRSLRTLSLEALSINGDTLDASEEEYQRVVLAASGMSEYLDWILTLRYLVFYFDDRRSLVWDPTAQRRLLRLLFLPREQTHPEGELAAKILSQDSYYRNVSATLTRQEIEFKRQELVANSRTVTELELEVESRKLVDASARLDGVRQQFAEIHDRRASARLSALRADQEKQEMTAELENLRFEQIRLALPTQSESNVYWLTQLLAEQDCIVCGTHVPEFADILAERLASNRCVMCDSPTEESDALTAEDFNLAEGRLLAAAERAQVAQADRDETEAEFNRLMVSMTELESEVSNASSAVERLQAALPAGSRELTSRREALAQLRMDNAVLREKVLEDKRTYAALVEVQNLQIAEFQEGIKRKFDEYAKDFLLESCALVWDQSHEQLGQVGQSIKFSVFRVDMTGGAFLTATRRDTADQVSESQREFIDLAFRMALIRAASSTGDGSLVIDAPESSLDAVFAPRAARVLTQFGSGAGDDSRVILTSNLVDGQLIPTIAEIAGITGPADPRVVNLFELAAPTAALTQLRAEYDLALERAFAPRTRP